MLWRKLLVLFFAVSMESVFPRAMNNHQIKVNFSGKDRNLASINWNGTPLDFSTIEISDMDAGYIEIQDLVVISELSSNAPIKITATHGGWGTLPTGYTGNKTNATGDVQIKVDNLLSGFYVYSGTNYGNAYTAISNTGNDHIIETAGAVSGLTGDINARILLDWSSDIVGNYALTLNFTVTNY